MNKVSLLLNLLLLHPLTMLGVESMQSSTNVTEIKTSNAPKPVGPFSQALKRHNAQEMLFISGQLPIDPTTNVLETDLTKATELVMHNLAAILKEAGMDFSNVVKTTIFLTDMNDFAVVNKIYESFLTRPYPARSTFQVAGLPKGGCIEIEMIAVK